MNAPKWVIDKRVKICTSCEFYKSCDKRFTILQAVSHCPANKWKDAQQEIKERAWPESAARVSGCCDSAINYGD